MPPENEPKDPAAPTDPKDITPPTPPADKSNEDDIEAKIAERVATELKAIKDKLNAAYGERDKALSKVAEFEQAKRDEELQRMKDEGKFKEAYELQLAEEKARREALEKKNIELTRDIEVRNALGSQPFRNDKALEMARQEIVSQLVRNEQGEWVHKSGVQIKDFVKSFSESEDNAFLFKQKVSTGSGSPASTSNPVPSQPASLFGMTQAEVIKLAREGKLPKK